MTLPAESDRPTRDSPPDWMVFLLGAAGLAVYVGGVVEGSWTWPFGLFVIVWSSVELNSRVRRNAAEIERLKERLAGLERERRDA